MRIRRRFVTVAPGRDDAYTPSAAAVEAALMAALAQATHNAAPSLQGWPAVQWSDAAHTLRCEGWTSRARPEQRLVTVALAACSAPLWEMDLRLAATAQDEFMLCEETRVPTGSTLDDLPDLFAPLVATGLRDGDGQPTGVVRRVDRLSIGRFADFVHAPERTLPIVLLSPTDGGAFLVDRHALARALLGMAHVVALDPRFAWPAGSAPLHNHPCFGGAIRVYQPGYEDAQGAGIHRYWKPTEVAQNPARAFAAMVDYLADLSGRGAWQHPAYALLEAQRTEELQRDQIAAAVANLRAGIERRASGDISAAEQLVDELNHKLTLADAQKQEVIDENKLLRTENWNLKARIRQLQDAQEEQAQWPEDSDICHIMLSRQAQTGRSRMDHSMQAELDIWLLRLRTPEARTASSDIIRESGGLQVYPRGHAADGMRIIWYDGEPNVRVCEVFRSHAYYERERSRGLRVENYTEFSDITDALAAQNEA